MERKRAGRNVPEMPPFPRRNQLELELPPHKVPEGTQLQLYDETLGKLFFQLHTGGGSLFFICPPQTRARELEFCSTRCRPASSPIQLFLVS
jgi:hypothetical protein